jgi:hypothetical protein
MTTRPALLPCVTRRRSTSQSSIAPTSSRRQQLRRRPPRKSGNRGEAWQARTESWLLPVYVPSARRCHRTPSWRLRSTSASDVQSPKAPRKKWSEIRLVCMWERRDVITEEKVVVRFTDVFNQRASICSPPMLDCGPWHVEGPWIVHSAVRPDEGLSCQGSKM